jgi:hypothetical protein
MQKSAPSSSSEMAEEFRPRLFEADLTAQKYNINFNKNIYEARVQITAYGDIAFRASDCAMTLIETYDEATASKHFCDVSVKHPALRHEQRKLQDHIEVLMHDTESGGMAQKVAE